MMSRLLTSLAFLAVALPAGRAAAEEETRVCLSPAETREAVADHNLTDPVKALRSAAAHARAEALRSRLCRWNEDYVYEITLLRRDGKVMHVFVKAADGSFLNARSAQ